MKELVPALIILLSLASCAPKKQETPPNIATVTNIAAQSKCAKYRFKDRSVAPIGYIKGMALMYAKAICKSSSEATLIASSGKTSSPKDFFNKYSINPSAGAESLKATYNLLIGLGMRESSGRYCEGRDLSMGFTEAISAEAGLFQTSYVAKGVSPALVNIYNLYKNNGSKCFLEIFKEGVDQKKCTAADAKTYGTGEGATFQKLSKSCPGFTAEWASITVRKLLNHYGPLKQKTAEMVPVCGDMLTEVQKAVATNPNLCELL